jgi:ring-1,2-phenylacetyl-CoA epoxidase subunit PaaC
MNADLQRVLTNRLLAFADDELILGHRNSEWAGHAPILEEDIAFANIAQDEMGHAAIWYQLYCEMTGEDPDRLVFERDAAAYQNVQMVELPNGDWAFSLLRQYLFDAAEMARLIRLLESGYGPMKAAAAKIRPEEMYHYRHTSAWVRRLGLGTEESHRRMQNALDQLWFYAQQLFVPLPDETMLAEAGYVPEPAGLRQEWEGVVVPFLTEAGLQVPATNGPPVLGREEYSPHRVALLTEMQEVARAFPGAEW